jgi:hypothetical protein
MKKLLFPIIALCFSVSFAQFDDEFEENEWANYDYEHAGLTQTEFQNVKKSGMKKEKLTHLLEIGVRPADYLKEPWKSLGVTEKEWLAERAGGMDDNDIDRTYTSRSGNQGLAYLSFLAPSLYQWSTDQYVKAIAMDVAWAALMGTTIYLAVMPNDGDDKPWAVGAGLVIAVHLWSGIDALISTLWDSNPDARNFSFGVIPTGKNSFAAAAALRF